MKKFILIGTGVILFCLVGLLAVRFILGGDEDSWICENGGWIKHGNPSSPMPSTVCTNQESKNKESVFKELTSGQKYKTFSEAGFEVNYPDWPNINQKYLLEQENVRLAVSDNNCNFIITTQAIPQGNTFKDYTNKLVGEQAGAYKSKITRNEIEDDIAYVEGQTEMNGITLRTASFSYLVGSSLSYTVGFISQDSMFDKVCEPFISDIVGSITIK